MRSSRCNILYPLLVLLAMGTSCRQEICYDHYPAMFINFGWELEWERDYGMGHFANWDPAVHHCEYDELRPGVPEWVKMVRYFDDGNLTERFFAPEGSKFEVYDGDPCSMLFYNGDTEYIILSDVASLNNARATATTRTRSGVSLQDMQELYQVTRTTNPPDVLYSAYIEYVPEMKMHEVKNLPIKMQPLVFSYLISYEFEHGIEHVALARGALGGMAEGVYLRTGTTTDETSIILFDCDQHDKTYRSVVRSFGIPGFPDSYFGRANGSITQPISLNLEVKLKNGKTINFTYDITDQMKNQPRGGIIKITGIDIKDEWATPPSSGFDVEVTEWGEDGVVDINLGDFTG